MRLVSRPAPAGVIAVMGLAFTAYTGAAASGAMAAPTSVGPISSRSRAAFRPRPTR